MKFFVFQFSVHGVFTSLHIYIPIVLSFPFLDFEESITLERSNVVKGAENNILWKSVSCVLRLLRGTFIKKL